jgi:hypothetical protein
MVGNVIGSDISTNHFNPISNPLEVKWVSALLRQECVDDNHLHTQFHERAGKIAADKAHAAGNQHGSTIIFGTNVIHFESATLV